MKIRTLILVIFLAAAAVFAQAKEDKIKSMLEMTGSDQLGIQVMESLIEEFKGLIPGVPDSYWDKFMEKITGDELVDLVVPLYSKYFTEEEIDDLIAFYKTKTGAKYIEILPDITDESMIIGQEFGQQKAMEILMELQKDGYYNI